LHQNCSKSESLSDSQGMVNDGDVTRWWKVDDEAERSCRR